LCRIETAARKKEGEKFSDLVFWEKTEDYLLLAYF
jgi:hypothetical protein